MVQGQRVQCGPRNCWRLIRWVRPKLGGQCSRRHWNHKTASPKIAWCVQAQVSEAYNNRQQKTERRESRTVYGTVRAVTSLETSSSLTRSVFSLFYFSPQMSPTIHLLLFNNFRNVLPYNSSSLLCILLDNSQSLFWMNKISRFLTLPLTTLTIYFPRPIFQYRLHLSWHLWKAYMFPDSI